ncbi:MAG: hypothetical protein QOJ86_4858 [Bradyrhizobium sp.]|jgi:hypothetical protein|nr:hypothetical protein [Bradyrhizobium sp.]
MSDQSDNSHVPAPRGSVINPASANIINSMGICYLLLALLFFYLLIAAWPVLETPKTFKLFNIFGIPCRWAPDRHMLFLVMVAGALGSLTYTWTSFGDFVGNRELSTNWIWFFVLRIPIGIALAVLFYFIIRGGLLIPTVQAPPNSGANPADATVLLNPYSIAAFSALAGMFSKQATDKLAAVFDVVFTKRTDREGALGSSKALKVVPPELTKGKPVDLTVTGAGFQSDTKATINGKDRTFTRSSETEGKVAILADDVNDKGTLKLVVTNPNKDFFAADVNVVEPAVKAVISSTNPTQLTRADPKPLTITGTDFDKAAKATINGKDRPVQWASATQLTVTTAADDVVTAAKVKLAIKNPNADAAELMIDVVEPHS